LCQSRAIDLLRKQNANRVESLDDQQAESLVDGAPAGIDVDEIAALQRSVLLRQAEEVQDAVRRRVDERTWQVFWNIAIEGQSVREASETAGISYYAAFAAQKRIGRMLRQEGQRLMVEGGDLPESDGAEID
jgi:DNA-directed RNA polymerase specialized sigma24 family protein